MSDHLLTELGFSAFQDVSDQVSVARLHPVGKRCGIYVLGFADGERYVGKTKDITKRYVSHRKNFADLTHLTFKCVSQENLDAEEQRCIHILESGGTLLRNFSHMSVVRGERPFDEVVTPAEQDAWLRAEPGLKDDKAQVLDESLRRRQRHKVEQFMRLPHAEDALVLLGLYLLSTIPFPRRTEQNFWIVTCLPYGVTRNPEAGTVYCRVTVNMQENMSIYGNEKGLDISFHTALSPLKEWLGHNWKEQLKKGQYEVTGHRYKVGGQDQTEFFAFGREHAEIVLTEGATLQAMALLNLRLMRKGGSYQPSSHCPQLVDAATEAALEALAKKPLRELQKTEPEP